MFHVRLCSQEQSPLSQSYSISVLQVNCSSKVKGSLLRLVFRSALKKAPKWIFHFSRCECVLGDECESNDGQQHHSVPHTHSNNCWTSENRMVLPIRKLIVIDLHSSLTSNAVEEFFAENNSTEDFPARLIMWSEKDDGSGFFHWVKYLSHKLGHPTMTQLQCTLVMCILRGLIFPG